ncbi:hypothetical protein ACIBG8_05785 [Nonomuraea sp. NPDC050556]|uniref:hypothetical protein n=1 Tax=Nonomuraea sp. NPDC050556 TaxID=3364369 RepID=UPI0037BCF01B
MLAAVLCLAVLTACSSGNRPDWWRTNQTDAQVGPVGLAHVNIEAPPMKEQAAGGTLPLYVTLFNSSDVEQVLDAVSTVEARKVVYRDGSAPPVEQMRLTIPPKGELSLQKGQGRPYLELVGVNRQLGAAPIAVTFRFPTAGSVTVRVPVLPVSTPEPS